MVSNTIIIPSNNVGISDSDVRESSSNKKIPKRRRRNSKSHIGPCKVSDADFEIPSTDNVDIISKFNFNLKQLKNIAKHYKVKVSGNKCQLRERIVIFFNETTAAICIQKHMRRCFVKFLISNKGPAIHDRKSCTNETDFFTMEDLSSIGFHQFISYTDKDKFTYGFDIMSLNEYFKTGARSNPYNRTPFPKNLRRRIRRIKALYNIVGINIQLKVDNVVDNIQEESLQEPSQDNQLLSVTNQNQSNIHSKVMELFHIMDTFGHTTDVRWFLNLNSNQLIRFLRELNDIWSYRANLTRTIQQQIVHPTGHPFSIIQLPQLQSMETDDLRYIALKVIENIITKGINDDSKGLGVYFVLSAFTLASPAAAQTMPWLFESVQHF